MNGARGERFFDSGCTLYSCRDIDGGGSVIDFFACSAEICGQLQSLHIDEKTHNEVTTISFRFCGLGLLRFHVRQRRMTPKSDSNLAQTDRGVGVLLDHLLRTRS